MRTELARFIVVGASTIIADAPTRRRCREQWLADVAGATELGMSPIGLALGAAVAAVRLAAFAPLTVAVPQVGQRVRRYVGVAQLLLLAPILAALAYWGLAKLRSGLPNDELLTGVHDPKDLVPHWLPLSYYYSALIVFSSAIGLLFALPLAPIGAFLSIGGRRLARWLPLCGTLAFGLACVFVTTDFGRAVYVWLGD